MNFFSLYNIKGANNGAENIKASNPMATGVVEIIVASLVNTLFDRLAKFAFDKISLEQSIGNLRKSLDKSSKEFTSYDGQTAYQNDVQESFDNFLAQLESLCKIIIGEENRKVLNLLLVGPPGVGKTTLFGETYKKASEYIDNYMKMQIPKDLDSRDLKIINDMRTKAANKKLILPIFIAGSFFEKYGDQKLQVLEKFFNYIENKLAKNHIVFLFIDEIDATANYNDNRSFLATQFLISLDNLYSKVEQGVFGGKLILICTTNKSNLDYSIARRIAREFIAFNLPDLNTQTALFKIKMRETIIKEKKFLSKNEKLLFDVDKILTAICFDLSYFIKQGINFTGAEVNNIILNFIGTLTSLSNDKLEKYGTNIDDRALFLLKYYMIKEALKVLKINQKKYAKEIQTILNVLWEQLEMPAEITPIHSGSDWGSSD